MKAKVLVVLSLVFMLFGCATVYRSPGAENVLVESFGVLENNNPMTTNIIEVDGKHRGVGWFSRYELAPGEHTVMVSLYVGIGARGESPTIGFKVVAGEVYELLHDRKETHQGGLVITQWQPYIINKRTRERVDFAVQKPKNQQ